MRMYGRLGLHAESVVLPLLAADAPVVGWWHAVPPDRLATDALAVLADRRITDSSMADDAVAALKTRATDYAPGDTDLAWTRTTPWRSLLAGALDTTTSPVTAATVTASVGDPTAELLAGWLRARLRLDPDRQLGGDGVAGVGLRLANGQEVTIVADNGSAVMSRTGLPKRTVPLTRRPLGEQLAEELRRLDADQPFANALSAATGVPDLSLRPGSRVHIWHDPAPAS
jgi:glucose-6-phosphate dehydrogenase assembly protein OpcA